MKTAAVELGVTSGAISQQVRFIEELLQIGLFHRGHRQLTLSEQGAQLYRIINRNFTEIEQAIELITSGPASKKIRLKLLPSLAIRWFVPRLASFYSQHPGFDVEVATGMPLDDKSLDDVDFSCRLGLGSWEGLKSLRLFQDSFIPVCAPALAASIRNPLDVLLHPLLHSMMRMDAWAIWFNQYGSGEFQPHSEIKFANAALAYQAAAEGLGIAMGQYAYVEADLMSGRLVAPFAQAVATTGLGYYLVWPETKAGQPKNSAFVQWMENLVRSDEV